MATRLFSDAHLERLRSFPDIDRDQLIRFFTLTPADVAFIDPGRGRGPADRLGLAVQLCTLPWLGFVPDEVTGAPGAAVHRLAERLQVDSGAGYGRRGQTRTDHLRRGRLPGMASGTARQYPLQGAAPVPARPGDGARFADAAVQPGRRLPDLGEGDPARP